MPSRCCLCGSTEYRSLAPVRSQHDGREFLPVRCLGCSLVGLEPRLSLSELLGYYEGQENREDLEPKIRARFRSRVELVTAELPGRGRILDVGCGRGQFLASMRDVGWEVVGVEADAARAGAGAAEFEIPIHRAAFDSWEHEGCYRAITGWHVFEHFVDPCEALRRAARLLEPGAGRLFVEVPNFHSLGVLMGGASWVHFDVPYHQHFFTPETLSRVAEKAGLEVLRTSRRPLDSDWWSLKRTLQRCLSSFPGRFLRPFVSFRPVPWALVWLGSLAGFTETFQLVARRRP